MTDIIIQIWDIIIHIDKHTYNITALYGNWTYVILFLIIFCETGLIVTPFLPGDSLLFAAGAISTLGSLDPILLIILLSLASIIGDNVNYWVGRYMGPKVFNNDVSLLLNKKHIKKTQDYYDKYGNKTIVIARFIPIVRTVAPFMAGIGIMEFKRFTTYNIIGALMWIILFISAGYYFGNIPFVKKHFTIVVLAVIIVSMLPLIVSQMKRDSTTV